MAENKNHPEDHKSATFDQTREEHFSHNANVPAPMVSQHFEPPEPAAPVEAAGADD